MYLKTVDTIRYNWIDWNDQRSGFYWIIDYKVAAVGVEKEEGGINVGSEKEEESTCCRS